MNFWQALLLGFIQGIAEFFPISSSGHLVIVQNWLSINPPPFYFDIFIHLVSLIAIVIFFYKPLLDIITHRKWATVLQMIVGSIPIFIIGYLWQSQIEQLFISPFVAGLGLLITAGFNFITSYSFAQHKKSNELNLKNSLLIGLAQVLALVPGISRSGTTLFAASQVGIEKTQAFRFSFYLALPAILGANVAQLITTNPNRVAALANLSLANFLLGGAVCLATSLLSLIILKKILANTRYHWFGYYCLVVSLITLSLTIF
jgi:undecaprenyl-diphosphatase